MHTLRRLVAPLLLSTAFAGPPAVATPMEADALHAATGAQLRWAYLECDRISSTARVDQAFMVACQQVGDALKAREFGGDFERQLQWWRAAREAHRRLHGFEQDAAAADEE